MYASAAVTYVLTPVLLFFFFLFLPLSSFVFFRIHLPPGTLHYGQVLQRYFLLQLLQLQKFLPTAVTPSWRGGTVNATEGQLDS